MNDNKSYLEAKRKDFFNQFSGDDAEDEWNKLRSQINSGLFLGLSHEKINKYAISNLSYEQREIIKFALFTNLPEEQINSMIKNAIDNNANEELLLKEYENYRFIQFQDASQMEKYQQLFDLIKKNDSTEELQKLLEQVKDLEAKLKDKEQEIVALKKKYNETVATYEKALQSQVRDAPIKTVHEKKKKIKRKRFWFFGKNKMIDFIGKTVLPDDFNFVKYIASKKLSSSQLELVTIAIKLNVSKNAIYDIVESGADAEHMKQLIEGVLATRDLAEKAAHNVDISDLDCFH